MITFSTYKSESLKIAFVIGAIVFAMALTAIFAVEGRPIVASFFGSWVIGLLVYLWLLYSGFQNIIQEGVYYDPPGRMNGSTPKVIETEEEAPPQVPEYNEYEEKVEVPEHLAPYIHKVAKAQRRGYISDRVSENILNTLEDEELRISRWVTTGVSAGDVIDWLGRVGAIDHNKEFTEKWWQIASPTPTGA